MWTTDGLKRVSALLRQSCDAYYRGRLGTMGRFSRTDRGTLAKLENAWNTGLATQEKTVRDIAPFVQIPDLKLNYWRVEDEQVNPAACFTGSELVAVGRGIITPRVTDEDPIPPLSKAILEQAERMEHDLEFIAREIRLPVERIERVIALGGWGVGTYDDAKTSFGELASLGTWYGDVRKLADIYGITQ